MNICRESPSYFCPREEDSHSYIVCIFPHFLVYKVIFHWSPFSCPASTKDKHNLCLFHAFLLQQWGLCSGKTAYGYSFPKAPNPCLASIKSIDGGGGHRQLNSGSSARGLVPIQQIRLGQITQCLFWDKGSLATWPCYPALCSQHPGSHQTLVSQSLFLKIPERIQSWSREWETAGGHVVSLRAWRILPSRCKRLRWLLCLRASVH